MIKRCGRQCHQLQPVLTDAMSFKFVDERSLHIWRIEAFVLYQQPAVRYLPKDTCPKCHTWLSYLRQATETPESNEAIFQCRELVDIRDARRGGIAEEATRHSHQLFAEVLLRFRGVDHRIGYPVVDCTHTRGVVVADVSKLHGRRFQRSNVQAVVCSVAGELHEDVDLILADQGGHLVRRSAEDLFPVRRRHHALEELCLVVLARRVRVEEYLEEVAVVMLEQRMAEERHRVMEEVRRDVTNPQSSVRRPLNRPVCERRTELDAETLGPRSMRLEHALV
mmetsp:Transcript_56567/g.143114  ORF Transcript_56567/g.143114 Transcript_56567/m.143114 type:complete len:280 (-) Transcript_56567:1158-1997(-)